MKRVNPSTHLRALAQRYRQTEAAGFPNVLLMVVMAAGAVVLLAYFPTHALLLVAYALALAAALAVLFTIVAMVNGEVPRAESGTSVSGREKRSAAEEASAPGNRVRPERRVPNGATSAQP